MKYCILGFNQKKVMKLNIPVTQKKPLNMNDLILLDYIQKAVTSYKLEHITDEYGISYVWLNHKKILADLPILNVGEQRLAEMLTRLVDFQLITVTIVRDANYRGSKSYERNYA